MILKFINYCSTIGLIGAIDHHHDLHTFVGALQESLSVVQALYPHAGIISSEVILAIN